MKLLALILFLFVTNTYASGCSVSDEISKKYNVEHSSKIVVKVNNLEDEYHVVIEAPTTINKQSFRALAVVKKKSENSDYDFVFPISVLDNNDIKVGWFNISEDQFKDLYLYVEYGEGCGMTIEKAIDYH